MSQKLSSKGRGYANLAWLHDAGARPGKRGHRYGLILGYAHALSQRTNLVSDLVLRQQQTLGKAESIVEIGFRYAPIVTVRRVPYGRDSERKRQ
jgi:hypothetical protein